MAAMGRVGKSTLALASAFAAIVAVSAASSGAARERGWVEEIGPGNFADRLLEAHNAERRRVGVTELRWSTKLAREAQAYAKVLARKQALVHANREERDGAGENLWAGSAGFYTAEEMIEGMIEEKRHFKQGAFPQVSRTGQWRDVGHYTQLIWRETTDVGCAVAPGGGQDWLVCRYWPAGNIYGRPVL